MTRIPTEDAGATTPSNEPRPAAARGSGAAAERGAQPASATGSGAAAERGAQPATAPIFTLSRDFSIGMIWAQTPTGVIGAGGTLPWRIPEDLVHFKATTLGHYVLHGRTSYEALPPSIRPLPGRHNIVLTTQAEYQAAGAVVVHSLAAAYAATEGAPLWIVGGGRVYAEAFDDADALVISDVDLHVDGDTYAPRISPDAWQCVQRTPWITSTAGVRFRISEYRRRTAARAVG